MRWLHSTRFSRPGSLDAASPVGDLLGPQPGPQPGSRARSGSASIPRSGRLAIVLLLPLLLPLALSLAGQSWAQGPAPGSGAPAVPEGVPGSSVETLGAPPGDAGGDRLELKELARAAKDSVVMLRILGATGREVGTGTGFFVDPWTLVTNAHVIASATRVQAVLADGSALDVAGIVARDVPADLAVLRLAEGSATSETRGLRLAEESAARVEPGTDVVVLGNPLGLSGTLSTGIVSAVRPDGIEPTSRDPAARSPRIQITAAISPGSSGSPVMDSGGEVIGVAVSQILFGQNLNFAVPVSELRPLLATAEPGRMVESYAAPGKVSPSLVRNLVLSVLAFGALVYFLRRST